MIVLDYIYQIFLNIRVVASTRLEQHRKIIRPSSREVWKTKNGRRILSKGIIFAF